VDEGILRTPDEGPYYILRARILDGLGQAPAAKQAAEEGLRHFPPPPLLSRWELAWFEHGAELLGRAADVKTARSLRERSGDQLRPAKAGDDDLPAFSQR